jgi:hypothetical protein
LDRLQRAERHFQESCSNAGRDAECGHGLSRAFQARSSKEPV